MSSSSPTTAAAAKTTPPAAAEKKLRPCLPPGLELLLLTTTKTPVSGGLTPFTATVLVVHWSVIRSISENKHFRLIPNEDDATTTTTEVLPEDWRTRIGDLDGSAYLTLTYRELSSSGSYYEYSVKLIELVKDKTVVVVCKMRKTDDNEDERLARQQRAKDRGLSTTTLIQVDEFLDTDKLNKNKNEGQEIKNAGGMIEAFKVQGVWELQSNVQNVLLNCAADEGCEDPKRSSPVKPYYSSNLTSEQKERLEQERKERMRREDEEIMRQIAEEHRTFPPPHPGMIGGGIPGIPFQRPRLDPILGDFGRSDLDPFRGGGGGGFGGGALGGMLMDPRGFRRPNLPPGVVPPGARFDPIGPLGGGGGGGFGGGFGGGRGGGGAAGGIPFGLPNPDHERVPDGLDDMFT